MPRTRGPFVSAVAALLIGGCLDQPTEPVSLIGIEIVAAKLTVVTARLHPTERHEPALRALHLAGGLTAAAAVHPPEDSEVSEWPCERWYLPLYPMTFRAEQFGVTYVWDPALSAYVPGKAAGAPDCGARITVYSLDPVTDLPALPLEQIGMIDVVDTGSYPGDPRFERLEVVVMAGADGSFDDLLATYFFQSSSTSSSRVSTYEQIFRGRLEDAGRSVSFDRSIETEWRSEPAGSVDRRLEEWNLATTGVAVRSFWDGWNGRIDVEADTSAIGLDIPLPQDTAWSLIRLNGEEVGRIEGSREEPAFFDVSGAPLPGDYAEPLLDFWRDWLQGFGTLDYLNR